jgi:hypothetical protein
LLIRLTNRTGRLTAAIAVLSVLAGGSIYLFFRSGQLVFHGWLHAIGLDLNSTLAVPSPFVSRYIPGWIIFSLPGGLWAFAYTLIITVIWNESHSRLKYFWMISIPLLVLGSELLQWAGILRGTFCISDLVLGLTGIILGLLTGLKMNKKNHHEKSTS